MHKDHTNIPQHRCQPNPSARDGLRTSGLCQCNVLWSTRVRHIETPIGTENSSKSYSRQVQV